MGCARFQTLQDCKIQSYSGAITPLMCSTFMQYSDVRDSICASDDFRMNLFEIAAAPLLPVHHVVEDGDHDVPQVGLRHQRHLQEGADHCWDEVQLVLPLEERTRGLDSRFITETLCRL